MAAKNHSEPGLLLSSGKQTLDALQALHYLPDTLKLVFPGSDVASESLR